MSLEGKIALVTGASRGCGKGIALQLGEAGATVYVTGRTVSASSTAALPGSLDQTAQEVESRGGRAVAVACDHSKDVDTEKLFQRILKEQGRLDILVNNAFSLGDTPNFFGKPFWELPESIWDDANNVGLRNRYICSVKAAQIMVKQKSGLIITLSSLGGKEYFITPVYGIGKAATDRMAADCGLELKPHNVTYISLWPGIVKTERLMGGTEHFTAVDTSPQSDTMKHGANADFVSSIASGESPEFAGKCIVALAQDPRLIERTGTIQTTTQLGKDFNLVDIDGRKVEDGFGHDPAK